MDMSTLKRKHSEIQDGGKDVKIPRSDDIRQLNHTVHVGSRKSQLALIQTKNMIKILKEKHPEIEFPIETMQTLGDSILHLSLPKIGEKGLFTKELETALSEKRVDFLVHSLKDLPTKMPEGMALGAVYKRDDPHDCVLFHSKHNGKTLSDLPAGSIIGTSSLRRVAQLKRRYPTLSFQSIRGNLNTRLRKLEEESLFDAIILAKAGIDRMGWADKIGQILKDEILYAVGQGAIAVEIRSDDKYMMEMFGAVTDIKTLLTVAAERAFMRKLDGGCSTPVGCYAKFEQGKFSLRGICLGVDGVDCVESEVCEDIKYELERPEGENPVYVVSSVGVVIDKLYEEEYMKAVKLGDDLALRLLELGADEILKTVKKAIPQVAKIQMPSRSSDAQKL